MAFMNSPTRRTTQVLHQNADDLHKSGAVLHQSAEASPKQETTRRLHVLGDAVTTEAHAIDGRVDRLERRATKRSPR